MKHIEFLVVLDNYVRKRHALVIFQVNGDEEFNKWNMETSLKNREQDQPVIKVMVKKWRESSALEELEISEAV